MSSTRKSNSRTTTTTTNIPSWRKNLIELALLDINAKRNEYWFPSPQLLTDLLSVKKCDLALWYNVFDCMVLTIINLLLLPFLFNKPWYIIAAISFTRIVMVGVPRFVLALHYSAHLPIMRPVWFNNFLIEFLITPFFGLPPGVYRFHHIVMHHREDNIYPRDLSSTMPYNRGNILSLLHYWIRFEFAIWVELPYYLFTKRYYGMFVQSIVVIFIWWYGNYYIWTQYRAAFSLWLFLIPQFICSMALMWGNFSQHIFIDPKHYDDDHRLTVNLINTPYNQLTFNDGYHIVHHKYPKLHWSEMPKRFITDRELDLHVKNDAVCLKDIDWFMLGAHVWFGLWNNLVKHHFVAANQKQDDMNHEERIQFLKNRLIPCSENKG